MPFEKCPICGYQDTVQSNTVKNVMNIYIDPKTKEEAYLNNTDEKVEVKENEEKGIKARTWVRKDKYVEPAPTTPTTPVTPPAK